jgi:predicted RNA-binding protein with PIN domain
MKKKRIIVLDGYNVIRRIPRLQEQDRRSLEAGRDMLCRLCVNWKSKKAEVTQLVIVFDGDSSVDGVSSYQAGAGTRVVFTRTGEKADARILAIIDENPASAEYTVVSDDGEVVCKSRLLGAKVMSVPAFEDVLMVRKDPERGSSPEEKKSSLSPAQEREITESLRKVWGAE